MPWYSLPVQAADLLKTLTNRSVHIGRCQSVSQEFNFLFLVQCSTCDSRGPVRPVLC